MKKLKAHIWDFGGQELYHTTHQLFLTPDTFYILLNDNRKNDTDFYYWLNIVSLRASERCPILLVFNAKDQSPRQIIPGEDHYREFTNLIRDTIDINFADKDVSVFTRFRNQVQGHFSSLEILGKSFPAYWAPVRETLSTLPDDYLDFKDFAAICKKHKVSDSVQIRVLAETLYRLGVILYFPNVFGLENLIILRSQWCIDAMYAALDTAEIKQNGGRFNEQILAAKWSNERFPGKHLHLLKLMQYFVLCYPIDGSKDFIAPQLMPLEERRYLHFPETGYILYRFEYTFMPAGILTRLIALRIFLTRILSTISRCRKRSSAMSRATHW